MNDRTLNLLRKGNIDLSAIIGGPAKPTFSADDIRELLGQEKLVIYTAVKMKIVEQRPEGAFFSFLTNTIYDLSKYGIFKSVDRSNYNHKCCFILLYKQEAYRISNYRNQYYH